MGGGGGGVNRALDVKTSSIVKSVNGPTILSWTVFARGLPSFGVKV